MRSSLPSWRRSSSTAELLGQWDVGAARVAHEAKVDEVHTLDAQRPQIGLDALAQLLWGERGQPGPVLVAARADLRDELEVLGVGVQRVADEVVDLFVQTPVRFVEIGKIRSVARRSA